MNESMIGGHSAILCSHCGLEAITPEGGAPVEVKQILIDPLLGRREVTTFADLFCSLKCAADGLAKHGSGY